MALTEGPHVGTNAASESGVQAGGVMSALAAPAMKVGPLPPRALADPIQVASSTPDRPSARRLAAIAATAPGDGERRPEVACLVDRLERDGGDARRHRDRLLRPGGRRGRNGLGREADPVAGRLA